MENGGDGGIIRFCGILFCGVDHKDDCVAKRSKSSVPLSSSVNKYHLKGNVGCNKLTSRVGSMRFPNINSNKGYILKRLSTKLLNCNLLQP